MHGKISGCKLEYLSSWDGLLGCSPCMGAGVHGNTSGCEIEDRSSRSGQLGCSPCTGRLNQRILGCKIEDGPRTERARMTEAWPARLQPVHRGGRA